MILAAQGELVPLTLVLEDGDMGLFPEALIYDEAALGVGVVSLSPVAGGLYRGTFTVPTAEKFSVVYTVFKDAAHTVVDLFHGRAQDIIIADTPASSTALMATAIWDAPRSAHAIGGSFAEAMRVLLGSQGKANARWDNFVYDANGLLSSVRIRIFPNQATAAASTKGGMAEGEIDTITVTSSPDAVFPVLPETVLGVMP